MRLFSGRAPQTAWPLVTLGLCLLAATAQASPITVDGDLTDWGFVVADNNLSTFSPSKGINVVGIAVEDTNDTWGGSKFLGPGRGGQNFDIEVLAAVVQDGHLYVAMVSGQRPDNGFSNYAPGDFLFNTTGGIYGLEVGGGVGGGAGGTITEGANGSVYSLDSQGFATGHWDQPQQAGSLWFNPTWWNGGFVPVVQTQINQVKAADARGLADYIFTRNDVTKQHSIIEWALPLTAFDGNIVQSISYAPACDNDHLFINLQSYAIPEPTTAVLGASGLALVGLVGLYRRVRVAAKSGDLRPPGG